MSDLSRRNFILGASAALTAKLARSDGTSASFTAGQVVDRIRQQVGVAWRVQTVDQIVAGDERTPVHGIATTMMATHDIGERAAAAGKNMIVTHETPFYLHQDHTEDIKDDPTLKYKLEFIRRHNMAIFHFHDHWHARKPDGIAIGMMQQLGWEKNVDPDNPKQFTFSGEPGTFLPRHAIKAEGSNDQSCGRSAVAGQASTRELGIRRQDARHLLVRTSGCRRVHCRRNARVGTGGICARQHYRWKQEGARPARPRGLGARWH